MLRFVPNGVAVGVDGGKPTSRGLPPAAFWETGCFGSMQTHPHPTSRGAAVPQAVGAGLTHPSPKSRGATVRPASAVGAVFTHPSPKSRGLGCFFSFRMGWWWELTAASPRAGACRLRRLGGRGASAPCRRTPILRAWGDSAASRCRWLGFGAPKPHERGDGGVLAVRAGMRIDG